MRVKACVYRIFCPKNGLQNLRIFIVLTTSSEFFKEMNFSFFSSLRFYDSHLLAFSFVDFATVKYKQINRYLCFKNVNFKI